MSAVEAMIRRLEAYSASSSRYDPSMMDRVEQDDDVIFAGADDEVIFVGRDEVDDDFDDADGDLDGGDNAIFDPETNGDVISNALFGTTTMTKQFEYNEGRNGSIHGVKGCHRLSLDDHSDKHSDGDVQGWVDITEMRRGGMTHFDRRVRRTVLCFFVAALAAGAAVGLLLRAREEETTSSPLWGEDDRATMQASSRGYLARPPKDLARLCSPVALSTEEGWDECKRLCSRAECCMLPEGHWHSCRAGGNEVRCSAYEYSCETLDHIEKKKKQGQQKGGEYGHRPSAGGGSVNV